MIETAQPVYLDYNATTPLLPEVLDAMLPYLRTHFGNPSSKHCFGREAQQAVELARAQVASLLGCDADEVLFTSGGTEANNLAIRGVIGEDATRAHVVTSAIEHPATAAPCAWLERQGAHVTHLGVDTDGRVLLDEATRWIGAGTTLVTVMHSHNETGVIQPIIPLAGLARSGGALMHTDAAQSVGKVPVDVRALGVDLLSLAGHKLYAPKGVGALFVRRGVRLAPLMLGAGHERGLRPGTENVASIVGLGVACGIARRELGVLATMLRLRRDMLWAMLVGAIPGIELNGHPDIRLPNTLNVRFPGVNGEEVLAYATDVAASTGSACHSGQAKAPAAILAMGIAPEAARGSVRLTVGRYTSAEDVTRAADALISAWQKIVFSSHHHDLRQKI
jgi:cysteine desulfurase